MLNEFSYRSLVEPKRNSNDGTMYKNNEKPGEKKSGMMLNVVVFVARKIIEGGIRFYQISFYDMVDDKISPIEKD